MGNRGFGLIATCECVSPLPRLEHNVDRKFGLPRKAARCLSPIKTLCVGLEKSAHRPVSYQWDSYMYLLAVRMRLFVGTS